MSRRPAVRSLRGLAVAAAGLLLASCASLPLDAEVHQGPSAAPAPADTLGAVLQQPFGPLPGTAPEEVVRGFLNAQTLADDDHAVARQFLTPSAEATWDDKQGAVVYDVASRSVSNPSPCDTCSTTTVDVGLEPVAQISPDGSYSPAHGPTALALQLNRVDGQWRIANPPAGLLVDRRDLPGPGYRRLDAYFLTPEGDRVVPDPRLLPSVPGLLPAELVNALLAGPSEWLRPAVSNAFPVGTTLLNVPVVDDTGVVAVNLSGPVGRLPDPVLNQLAAQLVWTLARQLPTITAVDLQVEGRRVILSREPRPLTAADYPDYDPDVLAPNTNGYAVTDAGLLVVRPAGSSSLAPPQVLQADAGPLVEPALALTDDVLAALRPDRATLLIGPKTGRLAPVALDLPTGSTLTGPSWGRGTGAWVVAHTPDGGQRVLVVATDGSAVSTVDTPGLAQLGRVAVLRVSRDGTRVAVVAGVDRRVYVARVIRPVDAEGHASGQVRVDGFREVAPLVGDGQQPLADVADLSWAGGARLALLAPPVLPTTTAVGAAPTGAPDAPVLRLPYLARTDGSEVRPFAPTTRADAYDHVAALPDGDTITLMLEAQGLLRRGTESFEVIGPGRYPAYPG